MSASQSSSQVSNAFDLELQLQEIVNDLQWKSKALEEAQHELSRTRQDLYSRDLELEESKRARDELKAQLSSAHQAIEWLECERSRCTGEKVQLQLGHSATLRERDSLREQAHAARLEVMNLKLEVQRLRESLTSCESANKALETSLGEIQERFSHAHASLQSNLTKLEKEQQLLRKSVDSTTQLNKRLQTVGLCAHAVYTRKNNEIRELQKELAVKGQAVAARPLNIHANIGAEKQRKDKFNTKAFVEEIQMEIQKIDEADVEIDAILAEYKDD